MFQGISLRYHSLPDSLLEQVPQLEERTHRRSAGANPEVWFLLRDPAPVLPVWWEGQWQLVTWGRPGSSPQTARHWHCSREALEAGRWSGWRPEPVRIPADFGCDAGVWFDIREGIEGVLIQKKEGPEVYLLTQPASHYYEVTCNRADVMPCLIGQWV